MSGKETKYNTNDKIQDDKSLDSIFLNLGCGEDYREGYINIDIYSSDKRVRIMNANSLDFSDNSVDEILAVDLLECFSQNEISSVLAEWSRVLKPGGVLHIRVPSFELQVKAYQRGDWDADAASKMIYGSDDNSESKHSTAFDQKSIKRHLHLAGFQVISIEDLDYPQKEEISNLKMEIHAKKSIPFKEEVKDYSSNKMFDDLNFELDEDENPIDDFTENELKFDLDILEDFIQKDQKNTEKTNGYQLNIVWEGSQMVYHSLALINREQCLNLLESEEANITIIPSENEDETYFSNQRYFPIEQNLIHKKKPVSDDIGSLPYVWIRHQWPPKAKRPKGAKWIIMQPWEYDVLLESLYKLFDSADELWTPSNFSKQAFINSGIPEEKVHVIPNGINPDLFKPDGETLSLKTEKRFKILYVGGTIHRKGADILLNTYAKIFTKDDDVCLVIKDFGKDSFYQNQTAQALISKIQANENSPEILYLTDTLKEDDIAALYRSCNLFVAPYRGEGFSLPTLEAMACGLPVVVTQGGPTDDFVKEGLGFFIQSEKQDVGKQLDGLNFVKDAHVLRPNEDMLQSTLLFLYENPGILKSIGIAASYHARSKWTWKLATLKMLSRLDVIYGTNMAKNAISKLNEVKDAYYILGEAELQYSNAKFYDAYAQFKAAISMDELNSQWTAHAYNRLAIISIEKQDLSEAKEYIAHSEEHCADNPELQYVTAVYLTAKHDYNSALQYMTIALQRWEDNKYNTTLGINIDDLMVLGGDILRAVGDLTAGIDMYKNALKINHENYYACYGAGKCFQAANEDKMAKEMFEWAIKYNPNFELAIAALKKC